MKKAILCIGLALTMLLGGGCDIIDEVIQGVAPSGEAMYEKLDSLASNPDGSTELNGSFTFVAYISDDAEIVTVEGEDCMYQTSYICRNVDDPIFLDVTKLTEFLPADCYAKVTGTVDGYLYATEDNKRVEYLNIAVTAMEEFIPSKAEPSSENLLSLKDGSASGEVTFLGAHHASTSFDEVIVLYFEFKNTAPESNVKLNTTQRLLSMVDFYVGDTYTTRAGTAFSPDDLDGSALDYSSLTSYTPSGKTGVYYVLIKPVAGASAEDYLYMDLYDDEFAWTNSIGVPIYNSLAEMNQ